MVIGNSLTCPGLYSQNISLIYSCKFSFVFLLALLFWCFVLSTTTAILYSPLYISLRHYVRPLFLSLSSLYQYLTNIYGRKISEPDDSRKITGNTYNGKKLAQGILKTLLIHLFVVACIILKFCLQEQEIKILR